MPTDPVHPLHRLTTADDETLLLLNRATLVMHAVRTTVHELNNVFQIIGGWPSFWRRTPHFRRPCIPSSNRLRATRRADAIWLAPSPISRARNRRGDSPRTWDTPSKKRRGCADTEHARGGIDLVVAIADGQPAHVCADALDVQLMVLNLLINAEQAVVVARVKTITIDVVRDADAYVLTVTDSGGGALGGADWFAPLVTAQPPRNGRPRARGDARMRGTIRRADRVAPGRWRAPGRY